MRPNRNLRRRTTGRDRVGLAPAIILTAVALLCAACSSSPSATTSSTAASGSSTTTTLSAAFPMTITSDGGKTVLQQEPRRIVSLSPTATETLYAIGAGRQVVAVDKDSDYPAGIPRTDIDPLAPNIEAIAGYKPDLVVVSDEPAGFADQMQDIKVPVVVEPAAGSLQDAYSQIEQLGAATGHLAAAATVVSGLRSRIAQLEAEVHPRTPPLTYYYELDPTYYSATSATFIGSVLAGLGLKDIADAAGPEADGGYPQLSAEEIVASAPDLILLADTICCGQSAATVAARPGWSTIPAVKDGEVVPLNDDIASRWGPRIVDLVADVVAAIKRVPAAAGSTGGS